MKNLGIILIVVMLTTGIAAQVVYEPVESRVYNFLSRMADKGLIELNDNILPLSHKVIFNKLSELENEKQKLTGTDKELLRYFLTTVEFEKEDNGKKKLFWEKDSNGNRLFYSYSGKNFDLRLNPILSVKYGSYADSSYGINRSGLSFYGHLGDKIGFSFRYIDSWGLKGKKYLDRHRFDNSRSGIWHGNDFSLVYAHVGIDWKWGSFVFGKENNTWGYGESGKIVRSAKAPSYPFMKLRINPVEWLQFDYMFGVLNSDVIDSSSIYQTTHPGESWKRELYITKYLVSHSITLLPAEGIKISLGESIINSDRFEPIYTIPIVFFRLADHYTSKNNNDAGGNSQFFAEVSLRNVIPQTHLYGNIIIDEIRVADILDKDKRKFQGVWLFGIKNHDLIANNLSLTAEYVRSYPFAYKHYVEALTYESSSEVIGHWIGENADLIYLAAEYDFSKRLNIKLWFEKMRKGDAGNSIMQYELPQPEFLWGETVKYDEAGVRIIYEPVYQLNLIAEYVYRKKVGKNNICSIEDYKNHDFSLRVSYGIR